MRISTRSACVSKSDWEKEMAQGQHLSKKQVLKVIPGQDGTDESKQGIYLFQKRMELEEFPLQLCTKINVQGKQESLMCLPAISKSSGLQHSAYQKKGRAPAPVCETATTAISAFWSHTLERLTRNAEMLSWARAPMLATQCHTHLWTPTCVLARKNSWAALLLA